MLPTNIMLQKEIKEVDILLLLIASKHILKLHQIKLLLNL